MKQVRVELTSMTSYKLTVDGQTTVYNCKLVPIPGRDPKKQEYVNPTHNEAWHRMLETYNQ